MVDHGTYTDIVRQIMPGTTMLTPNRRLAATLHKLYHAHQLAQQKTCWPTPDILPATSWIQRLWHDYINKEFVQAPIVLNNSQEQFLWEKIIADTKEGTSLLQVGETAKLVKSAWGLLQQWEIEVNQPIFNSAEDYLALQHWSREFKKNCAEKNWLDSASITELVINKIKHKDILPPGKIILIGFTELSPQLKNLLTYCEKMNSQVSNYKSIAQTSTQPSSVQRISLIDTENEILSMACWAKSLWQQDKNVQIGCVIPNLDKMRDRVMQVFSAVFAEENTYTINPDVSPFNISAGKSLSRYPIINTALLLLGLHKKSIPLEHLNYLLASPFLGEAEIERIKRANLDKVLRQKNIHAVDIQEPLIAKICPFLAKRLKQFFTSFISQQQFLLYNQWATIFTDLLSALGWPGERSLNSEEYQIVEAWLALLSEFSSLDYLGKTINFAQALQTLHKLTANAIFQPKTPAAPIQVLGVLEAAALPFDYLWVAGMDDVSWPPQPQPNPFIPKSLQRELHMPHATSERELNFCLSLIEQFKQSAKYVVFSHASKAEELELQISPLLQDLPEMPLEFSLNEYQLPIARIYKTKHIEKSIDETAPVHISNGPVPGGMNILKYQALCPFKAFAEWRLHAHELERPLPGLRSKERGTVTHKILELVWNKLGNHTTLVTLEENDLQTIIQNSIQEALQALGYQHDSQYLTLEKQRLQKLIGQWLQIEKNRAPFKVMMSEKAAQITLNQLTFSIRIDRIDELENGKKLIIDYKTGKNNEISHWLGERPEEPQLPLYSLLDTKDTVGISFAQINPVKHCFKGLSHYDLAIKSIKTLDRSAWEEQLTQWQTILTKLSNDFCQGVAKVDPKEEQTCEHCALQPLCRVNEL